MGSSSFFSKIASMDPLAQALNLPGAHKYAQDQAQAEAGKAGASGGPYTGVTPTLAGANAGYAPGGPGATVGWSQYVPHNTNNFFQKAANLSGNVSPHLSGVGFQAPSSPSFSTQNPNVQPTQTMNPYVTAARGAATMTTAGM